MKNKNVLIGVITAIIIVLIIILFLIFKKDVYEVTFISENKTIEIKEVKENELVEKPSDPILENYTFEGWYFENELFDFNTKITKDITLTAKFSQSVFGEEKIVVTFNSNGGTSIKSISLANAGTIAEPSIPTREGYTFISWQLNGKEFDFSSKVTESITLTAKWEKDDDTKSTTTKKKTTKKTTTKTTTTKVENNDKETTKKTTNPTTKPTTKVTTTTKKVTTTTTKKTTTTTQKQEDKYTFTVTSWAESDLQMKVNVYRNGKDITSSVSYVFDSSKINLGGYNASAGAILVKKSETTKIYQIYYNNEFIVLN